MSGLVLLGIPLSVRFLALLATSSASLSLASTTPEKRFSAEIATNAARIAAVLSIVVAPVVIIYLAANYWCFDSAVPVSGLAKMIGGPKFGNWGATMLFVGRWRSFTFLVAILLALEVIVRSRTKPDSMYYRSLAIVSISILTQCVYYGAFSAWYLWPWYCYLPAIGMALIVARILHLVTILVELRRVRWWGLLATALLALWVGDASLQLTEQSFVQDDGKRSYNQISLAMLADFFSSAGKSTIAMGDRAGGLAYWGRSKLSVIQTEGLTLDINYIRARARNEGRQYLLAHHPLDYLIVDRENVPIVTDLSGNPQYVVAEPIQGRVTFGAVSVFCFPEEAVRYKRTYRDGWATDLRMAFEIDKLGSCSTAAQALMKTIEMGVGLRQMSLPSEYVPGLTGNRKFLEDRDRARIRTH